MSGHSEKRKEKLRVLLTGGGTGGHVYPTLAMYRILEKEWDVEDVLYVGTRGRAEADIVPRQGIPIRFIRSAPLTNLQPLKMMASIWQILLGTLQALPVLMRFKPDLILAAGGYVSAPVTFASFLLRPFLPARLVLEEQNVIPGLMNKVASLFAHLVLVSFPETPYYIWNNRCVHTGYPVREQFLQPREFGPARQRLGIDDDTLLVMAFGGSMGSRSINRLMVETVPFLDDLDRKVTVIHSCGLARGGYDAWQDTADRLRAAATPEMDYREDTDAHELRSVNGRLHYRLVPYIYNMADYLAAANLVICRGGAGTIAEVTAAGKAAIVIPKRNLPGDHQEHNAIALAEKDGCEIIFERIGDDGVDFVHAEEFMEILGRLLSNPDRLRIMGRRARTLFDARFGEKTIKAVGSLLRGGKMDYVLEILEPKGVKIQKQVDSLVSFLRSEPPGSFYRRFYNIKMEENLVSASWQRVNIGIKLCGGLGRIDRIPQLMSLYQIGNGFMRRNILQALGQINVYDPAVPKLVEQGLQDTYFEVRAAAIHLAGVFADHVGASGTTVQRIRRLVVRRGEHFEVRAAGLKVLPLFIPLADYLALADPFRFARNVRLREAVLAGIRMAMHAGRIHRDDVETVRLFIQEVLITTSGFKPRFSIRETYVDLYQQLSRNNRFH